MHSESICADVLAYIYSKDEGVGFYKIARRFGLPDADYDLPNLIENLVADGYIGKGKKDSGEEVYVVTDKGRKLIIG